jgi:hypothetical protein
MRYFVHQDNTLSVCIVDDPVNPDNLLIVEIEKLPAPLEFCTWVDGDLQVKTDWEIEQIQQEFNTYVKQLDAEVEQYLLKKANAKGYRTIDRAMSQAAVEGPYQKEAIAFCKLYGTCWQMFEAEVAKEIFTEDSFNAFVKSLEDISFEV